MADELRPLLKYNVDTGLLIKLVKFFGVYAKFVSGTGFTATSADVNVKRTSGTDEQTVTTDGFGSFICCIETVCRCRNPHNFPGGVSVEAWVNWVNVSQPFSPLP